MASDLKNTIYGDLKTAMKDAEKKRVSAIRLILAAIKQKEIDSRIEADDSEVIAILSRLGKQRRDSITQFLAASRKHFL